MTLLKVLADECMKDSARWFGEEKARDIVHHSLSLCGEAGEVGNIVKKIDRGTLWLNDPGTGKKLDMELADVFIYLLNLAAIRGLDLEQAYYEKREINERRFGKKVPIE